MDEKDSKPAATGHRTLVERKSECELMATRSFDAPAHLVFEAWTKPELFARWWVPKSLGLSLLSCEMDVRIGGGYRLEFGHPASEQPMAFFGKYIDVVPNARLVWSNDESDEGAITTVTFQEEGGKTQLVLVERYPTKEALERSLGGVEGLPEQFVQLDEFLVLLSHGSAQS